MKKENEDTKKKNKIKKTNDKTKKEIKKINDKKEKVIKKETKIKNIQEDNEEEKTITFNLIEVLVIIVMTVLVTGAISGFLVYKNHDKITEYRTGKNNEYIKEFEEAYNTLLEKHVKNIDEKELINSAIKAIYDYVGDPYTEYLNESDSEDLTERLEGEYEGIGLEIKQGSTGAEIVTVFENSPAKKAGLEVGDRFLTIDGKNVTSTSIDRIASYIKNNNKDIKISVDRNGTTINVALKIAKITIPSVTSNDYNGVGYIKISTFANNTYTQFKKELEALEDKGIDKLIIDVRNNGGGYLNVAVDIAELFIEKGEPIYRIKKQDKTTTYKDKTNENRDYEIKVLINGQSASASEILASALKESYDADLVGLKSYGKGTVQEKQNLESGGMVKYTIAYWLTPNGNNINEIGLTPDIEIDGIYKEEMTYEEDTQLQSAIKLFE